MISARGRGKAGSEEMNMKGCDRGIQNAYWENVHGEKSGTFWY